MVRWGADTPIVGRERELVRLIDVLAQASTGRPGAVLIGGEAGVGKSRLIAELADRAVGATIVTGHCVDVGEGLPYLPFREALAGLPDGADLSGGLDAPGLGGQAALFELVFGALGSAAAERPVLLIIEDLHWADSATRSLLRYLLTRLRHQRLLVVATYRTDDLYRTHPLRPYLAEVTRLPAVERLTVDPLPDDAIRSLLRALSADVPPATLEGIVKRVDGNAFYAEEFLASQADGAATPPAELTDLLLTRIEALTPVAQRVLRSAAVAGRSVPYVELRGSLDLADADVDTALREITEHHLMHTEDGATYVFRHALMQEAAYRDLAPGERVRLHGRYAGLISADRPGPASAAERAHHLQQSNDLPGALSASFEAAGYAARSGAPAVQLAHLDTVLTLWSAVPDAAERTETDEFAVTLGAVEAAGHAGEFARAQSLAEAALRIAEGADDPQRIAQACTALASLYDELDRDLDAYQLSQRAVALTEGTSGEARLAALAQHSRVSLYLGRYDESDAAVVEALELARTLRRRDFEADLAVTMLAGGALSDTTNRQSDDGVAQLERALDLAREAGRPHVELRVLFNLAIGRYEAGALEAAQAWSRRGVALADRLGARASPYGGGLRGIDALTRYLLGDWTRLIEDSVDLAEVPAAGYVLAARDDDSWVCGAIRVLDDPATHRPWMATLHLGSALLEHFVWLADLNAAQQWHDRVYEAVTNEFHEEPRVRLAATLLGLVVDRALAATSDESLRSTAVALIETSRSSIPQHVRWLSDGPEAVAWQKVAEAEFARLDGSPAVEPWRAAYDAFGFGDVYHQALCQWRLAEQLVLAGDKPGATAEVTAALATAAGMGAQRLVARLRDLDARAGLGLTGATSRSGSERLTGREHDVLRELATGATNKQIGAALFISSKTASVHASNILAKLGANSRTEAAAIARRNGLLTPDR